MSTNDRSSRVRELFEQACDLPESERDAFLDRECGDDAALRAELRDLFAAGEKASGFLEYPLLSWPGKRIGRYTIKEVIAEGGMGVVLRAEQDTPRRDVAIKLIRGDAVSENALRRFRLEAEVLGHLDHPGIAQIFEAATTDTGSGEQPFFAMELIEGETLDAYVARTKPSIRERAELFARICDGVHHAHMKGIIHRDLKPANIIVRADGQPKIFDFGVARVTDSDIQATTMHTDIGQVIGTLAYMSPEQVRGRHEELDARSDIYGLGVVCYELLTGRLPQDLRGKAIAEAARIITDEDASTLGSAGGSFPVDLETIVGKCLQKERDRRYTDAGELAADLRRFLKNEPLSARPPSAFYQFRKFARRNRGALTIVSLITLSIVAIAVNATIQARRVATEAETASEVSSLLVGLFESIDPARAKGDTITVRQVLDEGVDDILSNEELHPLVRARALKVLGVVYQNLGKYDEAERLLGQAVTDMDAGDARAEDLAPALKALGYNYEVKAEYEKAIETYRRGLEVATEKLPHESTMRFEILGRIGMATMRSEGYEAGAAVMNDALSQWDASGLPHGERYAALLNNTGIAEQRLGNQERAAELYERSVAIYEELYGGDHPRIAVGLNNVAYIYKDMGELEKALRVQERATEMNIRLLGENHRNTAGGLNMQGSIQEELGNYEEAIALFERAIRIYENTVGADHPLASYPYQGLGHVYKAMGDSKKALENYQRSLAIRRKAFGPGHHNLSWPLVFIAQVYMDEDDMASAEPYLREAYDIVREKFPELHGHRTRVELWLAEALLARKAYDEAESILDEMHERLWSAEDASRGRKEWTAGLLADLHTARGETTLAAQYREEADSLKVPDDED